MSSPNPKLALFRKKRFFFAPYHWPQATCHLP
jgi:hypothetical protein